MWNIYWTKVGEWCMFPVYPIISQRYQHVFWWNPMISPLFSCWTEVTTGSGEVAAFHWSSGGRWQQISWEKPQRVFAPGFRTSLVGQSKSEVHFSQHSYRRKRRCCCRWFLQQKWWAHEVNVIEKQTILVSKAMILEYHHNLRTFRSPPRFWASIACKGHRFIDQHEWESVPMVHQEE